MEARVLSPLDAIETSLTALVTSLTTTNTFGAAPAIANDLVSADSDLTTALRTLKQHQENYARILSLRAEADRLQEQIRSTIRTCRDLRAEVLAVDPGVLDDSSDDEGKEDVKEVDYDTLLAFAARIGKHNAIAAREAEQDYLRRRLDSKDPAEPQKPVVNGETTGQGDAANSTQESQQHLAQIQHEIEQARIAYGFAFPAAEKLRTGALGRLQWLREQDGEQAVDQEMEKIRRAERPDLKAESSGDQPVQAEERADRPARSTDVPERQNAAAMASAPKPAPVKRKLDLGFPGSGSDDDDDDD